MLDSNVAQTLTLTVAAANSASPADTASAVSAAAKGAGKEADQPFAAVLQRQMASPADADIAKGLKELLHIPARSVSDAKSVSDDKGAEAAVDPDAILAWLTQLFNGTASRAADATASAGQYQGGESASEGGDATSKGGDATALAAAEAATMPVMIAAPSLPAATAAGSGQAAPADEPALARDPHVESVAANAANVPAGTMKPRDGAADRTAETEPAAPSQLSTPAAATDAPKPTAILAAADQSAAESSAPAGNAGNAPQAGATFDSLLNAAQAAPAASIAHARHSSATTASPATVASIETPVGARGWDAEVGDKLTWMVGRQETRAELVLNPPQMGRIEVSLSINGNQANALFVSANPAVREALENAVPQLRETLQGAGISLGQAQVGAESFQQQSAHGRENGDNPARGGERTAVGAIDAASVAAEPALRRGNGLVDTFA